MREPDSDAVLSPAREGRWVTSTMAAGFFCLILSPTAGMAQNPPRIFTEWLVVGMGSVATLIFALWGSAYSTGRRSRWAFGVAIAFALIAITTPLESYRGSFHDYPWMVAVPLTFALWVGAWFAHQRWLVWFLPLALCWWFQGSARQPSLAMPAAQTVRGVTMKLEGLGDLSVSGESAETFGKLDLENIEVEGRIPPALGFVCWLPHAWPVEASENPLERKLWFKTFPPPWARSVDLEITIPSWPDRAAAAVTVPVPQPGATPKEELTASGERMTLSVANVRWAATRNRWPQTKCLAMRITYSGFSYSGGTGSELRATDDRGRLLSIDSPSMSGSSNGATLEADVTLLDPTTRSIQIELFSQAQREQNQRVFRFRGVPH